VSGALRPTADARLLAAHAARGRRLRDR
jgi:hypothetical protein